MKIRGIMSTLFAVALIFAPQFVNSSSAASGKYSAQLISPTAGQVLYPGQKARVEWRSVLPPINLAGCEAEVWLSLDGGRSFTMCITPVMDPKAQYFYWTVPNLPTNTAVLDIRFGCEGWYPENYAPQPASMFTIATSTVPSVLNFARKIRAFSSTERVRTANNPEQSLTPFAGPIFEMALKACRFTRVVASEATLTGFEPVLPP